MTFFNALIAEPLTSAETAINRLHDMGIAIHVPPNSLRSGVECSELHVRPCLTGPFELPDGYEPASPVYLIHHTSLFQKDITVKVQHFTNLMTEDDCRRMAFVTASSTPEYRESRPVYTFRLCEGKELFNLDDQIGAISLQTFSFKMIVKRLINRSNSNQGTF